MFSAETIFFEFGNCRIVAANFNFLLNELNFSCGNYSREETIQGRKLYEEIRYIGIFDLDIKLPPCRKTKQRKFEENFS